MSTSNYCYKNALLVCAHDSDNEDDDIVNYECMKEASIDALSKIGFQEADGRSSDHDRSYGGEIIAKHLVYEKDIELFQTVIVIRSGYYAGFNIDWLAEEGQEAFKATDAQLARASARAEAKGRRAARVLAKFWAELRVVGRFSNGETVYELKK